MSADQSNPRQAQPWTAPRLGSAEERFVRAGCIHGDFQMRTVRSLERKGLFYHKITSPNGQCGPMVLTPLGEQIRAALSLDLPRAAEEG